MQTKGEHPAALLDGREASRFVQAYFEFCQLKNLYRQGWLHRGVPPERCESVAEHSLGVAVLALWLAESYFPELDTNKVLRMALLHDFCEIYAGDIIPGDAVSSQEKRDLEIQSVVQVFEKLPGGDGYLAMWEEFETGKTPEARFVRQLDRLEMGFQAALYRLGGQDQMGEFMESARAALSDEALIAVMEELKDL